MAVFQRFVSALFFLSLFLSCRSAGDCFARFQADLRYPLNDVRLAACDATRRFTTSRIPREKQSLLYRLKTTVSFQYSCCIPWTGTCIFAIRVMPSFGTHTFQRLNKSLYESDINQISTSWISTIFEVSSNVKQFHDRLNETIKIPVI